MSENLIKKSPNVPTEKRALARLERSVELGELEELILPGFIAFPRYLVTYMNSQTGDRVRSATVVSVTNQAERPIRVVVTWFKGFSDNSSPVGATSFAIPADFTVDFSSRDLPGTLTVCNAVCNPELVFDEGRAIVSSTHAAIGVSSRVYYTSGDRDEQLLAITDSKVVVFAKGNNGD